MSKIRNHYSAMLTHILTGSGLGAMWAILLLCASTLWTNELTAGLSDILLAKGEFGLWAGGMAGALGGLMATLAYHRIEIDEQPLGDIGRLFCGATLSLCLLLGLFAWTLAPSLGWFVQSALAGVLANSPALLIALASILLLGPALMVTHRMARTQTNHVKNAHHLRYSPITKKMGFEGPTG